MSVTRCQNALSLSRVGSSWAAAEFQAQTDKANPATHIERPGLVKGAVIGIRPRCAQPERGATSGRQSPRRHPDGSTLSKRSDALEAGRRKTEHTDFQLITG